MFSVIKWQDMSSSALSGSREGREHPPPLSHPEPGPACLWEHGAGIGAVGKSEGRMEVPGPPVLGGWCSRPGLKSLGALPALPPISC